MKQKLPLINASHVALVGVSTLGSFLPLIGPGVVLKIDIIRNLHTPLKIDMH